MRKSPLRRTCLQKISQEDDWYFRLSVKANFLKEGNDRYEHFGIKIDEITCFSGKRTKNMKTFCDKALLYGEKSSTNLYAIFWSNTFLLFNFPNETNFTSARGAMQFAARARIARSAPI